MAAEEEDDPRCGGSGELHQVLTPRLDHRDPAFEVREWVCPGCPDCEDPMKRDFGSAAPEEPGEGLEAALARKDTELEKLREHDAFRLVWEQFGEALTAAETARPTPEES